MALLSVAGPVSGQSLTTGAVSVLVADERGERLLDVLLTLESPTAGRVRMVTSRWQDRFEFEDLEPGEYTLRVERIGYAPRTIAGIGVRPQRTVSMTVQLAAVEGSIGGVGPERLVGGMAAPMGAAEWIPTELMSVLPGRRLTLDGVLRFTSEADESMSSQGLPTRLSAIALDGVVWRPVVLRPDGTALTGRSNFALSGFDAAQLVTSPADVEWAGASGSILSGYLTRGEPGRGGDVAGSWSGNALSTGAAGEVAWSDVQGVVTASGGRGETSRFSAGVSARLGEEPLSEAWPGSEAATQLVDANIAGMDARAYRSPAADVDRVVAGFATLNWAVAEGHDIDAGLHAAVIGEADIVDPQSEALTGLDGIDIYGRVALASSMTDALANRLRVTVTGSDRTAQPAGELTPLTEFAGDGLALGTRSDFAAGREIVARVTDAVTYRTGAHRVRTGIEFSFGMYRYEPYSAPRGSYLYGDVDQFFANTGAFTRIEGDAAVADWSDRTIAVFVQETYTTERFNAVAGVRLEHYTLSPNIRPDTAWGSVTNILNTTADVPPVRVSPRVSASLDLAGNQRVVLDVSGGVFHDRLDPLMLAAWQSDDGHALVRRVIGTVLWSPDGPADGSTTYRLTVLGGEQNAPRTMRVTGGLTVRPAGGTIARVSGLVRRTDNLPRRIDLNTLPLAVATDQHGREVYGVLVQQGGMILPEPGSNRLFTTHDEVAAITADGVSDYWGITGSLEQELAGVLSLIARYTYSRTTDDWFGAADGGWTRIAPVGVDAAWVAGTSDFDVPHRAVIAAAVATPIGLRLGAAYRLQSGRPFTPGFRSGVDVNADGNGTNDPAYVDPAISGITELVASNACLRSAAGGYAQRNSCRGDMVQALDASAEMRLFSSARTSVGIRVDAFDLLGTAHEVSDAALYLIDADGVIVADPVDRTVMLPLVANPDFGEPLTRRTSGRQIRLGISFNW